MLGGFEVFVDSRPVAAEAWAQRRATDLVKLLALTSGHRLPRDEVLEKLWPKLSPTAAASNLHKAASYTRRALGDRSAIVIRSGVVELAPEAEVKVFLVAEESERARRRGADRPGVGADTLAADLRARDERDAANTRPASGAVVLDTTRLSVDEVVEQIEALVAERRVRGS